MSERPPGVKAGDRVRITTIHTGTITEIDDTSFLLEEAHRGYVTGHVRGRFNGNEMTWVVIRPPEPPVGTVVLDKNGLAWQHADDPARTSGLSADPWWAAGNENDLTWEDLHDDRGPLTVIYEGDGRC